MGKHRKWFWISGLYDNKRDILLNGMILGGIHCTKASRVAITLFRTPLLSPRRSPQPLLLHILTHKVALCQVRERRGEGEATKEGRRAEKGEKAQNIRKWCKALSSKRTSNLLYHRTVLWKMP